MEYNSDLDYYREDDIYMSWLLNFILFSLYGSMRGMLFSGADLQVLDEIL